MSHMNYAITMVDVSLTINGHTILDGISLRIKKGEIVTIMGPNGAGKTTLLKTAAGLIKPTTGYIHIFYEQIRKKGFIGYIPQNLGLVNGLSVLSNIMIGVLDRTSKLRTIIGYYPKDIVDEAYNILQQLSIGHLAHTKVGKLSGGEKQRVAIARTLLQKPSIIFADEMASSLDLKSSHDVMRTLLEMRRKMDLTLIMTHHNPEFAKLYSETVYLMSNGRIIEEIKSSSFSKDDLIRVYGIESI